MADSDATPIRYVDAEGEFVESGAVRSAYLVNMNDPEAEQLIEQLKARRGIRVPEPAKTKAARPRRAKR
jgi:hypothetical protein